MRKKCHFIAYFGDFSQIYAINADRLCVTSKYLSETVKKYSGYPANHWINRYTALDISRLLRNPNVTIQELTDLFGFSSVSHLNRYVKNQLGVNPNEVRKSRSFKSKSFEAVLFLLLSS